MDKKKHPGGDVGSGQDATHHAALDAAFGVVYYPPGSQAVAHAREEDLYTYTSYIGNHPMVTVPPGDAIYWLSDDLSLAEVRRGPLTIASRHLATVIRGYRARAKAAEIGTTTTLPYVNGCSTRQIFPPERCGDPTLQLLHIPPHSGEQIHHIHSTTRVVYCLAGAGSCAVGMDRLSRSQALCPGMVVVLHPMCPHHFETEGESLLVLPLHVFSSPPAGIEFDHPMYNGTHRIGT
jgi:hypothetical protein